MIETSTPTDTRTPILTLDRVHFDYSQSGGGLHGVSLGIRSASMIAVIGPNGSGKSTLLRLVAGLVRPSGGTIRLSGRPLVSDRALARRIAYVPQTHDFVFPFPVLDVVLAGRSPYTSRFGFESSTDRAIAVEALHAVGMADFAGRAVTTLSVGERQLVSIARGLAQRPECLLLDEPTAALDLAHRWQVVRLIAAVRSSRRLATVIVTHDLESIDDSFDQVVALRAGIVVATGPPSEVIRPEVLGDVYGDRRIRTHCFGGRRFVWPETDA